MKPFSTRGLLFVACAAVMASGCGKQLGEVSGTVSCGGQPLPMATITFLDPEGRSVSGEVTDGRFSVPDVPVGGNIKVLVSTQSQLQELKDYELRAAVEAKRNPAQGRTLPPGAMMSPVRKKMLEEQETPEYKELVKKMKEMKER